MDRVTLEQLETHLEHLRESVYAAQEKRNSLALSLRTAMITDLLEDLALYFETATINPRPIRSRAGKQVE